MRISEGEQRAICKIAEAVFGKETEIFLFGSRVYDHLKGGDLDLYIRPCVQLSARERLEKKIDFLVQLKAQIGDRKIDVVLAEDPKRSIKKTALQEGILLHV